MKISWKMKGFEDVRRMRGVANLVEDTAYDVAARAGQDYVASFRQGKTRFRGIVYAGTYRAIRDNAKNNTLVKALGGG